MSKLSIIKDALDALRISDIQSLDDEREPVKRMVDSFQKATRLIIRNGKWAYTTKTAQLVFTKELADSEVADGLKYFFLFSPEVLFVNDVFPEGTRYIEEKTGIRADAPIITINYKFEITDFDNIDPNLEEAISCYLAYKHSFEITHSMEIEERTLRRYQIAKMAGDETSDRETKFQSKSATKKAKAPEQTVEEEWVR